MADCIPCTAARHGSSNVVCLTLRIGLGLVLLASVPAARLLDGALRDKFLWRACRRICIVGLFQ